MSRNNEAFQYWLPTILKLPERVWWNIPATGQLEIQATTQEEVREVIAAIGGALFWKKSYVESTAWWEYSARAGDKRTIQIYACRENPATCKLVGFEDYTVEERVPVAYECREVIRQRPVWDCGQGETKEETADA